MMKAFSLEYRLRYLVHGIIYALGFYAPWERYASLSLGASSWWLLLASLPAREHWISFAAATRLLLAIGCVFTVAGATLRVWGASYLGAAVVHSGGMHGSQVLADGPYRHSRNPLYLGTFFNTVALSLLMPPTGAIVAIALIALVQVRLIGAEEPVLMVKLGEAYRAYCAAVPRVVPSLRPRVNAAGVRPSYANGLLSELFVVGTAISFLTLGWSYNTTLLLKGVLISLGISIVARAFIPRVAPSAELKPDADEHLH